MLTYLIRRLIYVIPTLLAISLCIFLMIHLTPGDPARVKLGERATPEAIKALQREMGLDKPVIIQYFIFLQKLTSGDLGRSVKSNRPVIEEILERYPATIELAFTSMVFATILGIGLGILAAVYRGSWLDVSFMTLSVCGVSIPIFWLGIMLMLLFSHQLPMFCLKLRHSIEWFPILKLPVSGRISAIIDYDFTTRFYMLESIVRLQGGLAWDALKHLILPAAALGSIPLAIIARMTRASMLEVMGQEYILVARAKGLPSYIVVLKHALRNAMIPIITVIALQFGYLLGGAIITEKVFAWPGIGFWLLNGVYARDFNTVQGGALLIASTFVFMNLVADILYAVVNPKIQY